MAETAMVLSEEEWNDLADICQAFLTGTTIKCDPDEDQQMRGLAHRIIDAAGWWVARGEASVREGIGATAVAPPRPSANGGRQ